MIKINWLIIFTLIILVGWKLTKYFNATPTVLYKVISTENWEQSKTQDKLILPLMDKDFIHLATKEQLDGIINKFWNNESEFFILTIDVNRLKGKLVLEANPGGTNKYYHLYNGFIPTSAVVHAQKQSHTEVK